MMKTERVSELVHSLPTCRCTQGSFLHGCRHTARRLLAQLSADKLTADPELCHVCIGELGRIRGEPINRPVTCDCCGEWFCFTSAPAAPPTGEGE